jgi:urease accessory protein
MSWHHRPAAFGEPSLALLRLLQLFDSQFPVGAFAHSGGVETYAALGGGIEELREVLDAQIALGWGRSDLAAAYLAWRGEPCAPRLDALKTVPAAREASIGLGRRTVDLLRRLYPEAAVDVDPPHQAVVVGAAAAKLGIIDARELLLAYAHSLAMGTLAAGLRCMPLSPAQAQGLLAGAHQAIVDAVECVLDDPESSFFTCTPALDIRSHQQRSLRTRLFQS